MKLPAIGVSQPAASFMQRPQGDGKPMTRCLPAPDRNRRDVLGLERHKHPGQLRAVAGLSPRPPSRRDRTARPKIKAKVVKNTLAPRPYRSSSPIPPPTARPFILMTQRHKGMPFDHASVRHSVGEYVDGMAHTNGM